MEHQGLSLICLAANAQQNGIRRRQVHRLRKTNPMKNCKASTTVKPTKKSPKKRLQGYQCQALDLRSNIHNARAVPARNRTKDEVPRNEATEVQAMPDKAAIIKVYIS